MDRFILHSGDCLDVLDKMDENSVDAVVCDPPYELSNDGKQSPNRVLFEFGFPKRAHVDATFRGGNELALLVTKVLGLGRVGAFPTPPTAVPVVSVAFNGDPTSGNQDIKNVGESPVDVSYGDASRDAEPKRSEYLGCFALKLADHAAFFDLLNSVGSGFFSGGIGVGFGVSTSSLPSLLHSAGFIPFCNTDIGLSDDALAELVGAFRGAENGPVLRFDVGRASEERISANGAKMLCALLLLSGAEFVRAGAATSRLPPVLETRRISIIDVATNRALSFDLVVHPQSIASSGFMGKEWDGSKIAFDVALWARVLRVLKPGGHLVAFSGTRTYHRMVVAIEDAGFEIRDQLAWVYGSGFPKSLDVSKAIDKAAGAEREVVGSYAGATNVSNAGSGLRHDCYGVDGDKKSDTTVYITAPATDAARQWQGWGTALKPSWESICLARKPLSEGTVAANVLKWGTGALNIDATRIGAGEARKSLTGGMARKASPVFGVYARNEVKPVETALGRWPANFCHDGSEEVLALFPESKSSGGQASLGAFRNGDVYGKGRDEREKRDPGFGDSGSAARFFYCAKANAKDRIFRDVEEVEVKWTSEAGPCQVRLQVDTGQSLGRAIVASGSGTVQEWSTFLCGSTITDLCRAATRSTIRTKTNSTTELKTLKYLTRSLISACILGVNCEAELGSNPVENAGMFGLSLNITLAKTAYLPGASRAVSGTQLTISVNAKRHSHPTIKPVALMRWLVRMVTPPGGTVLDPFAGTGTTGQAAIEEGFNVVLVEREEEYQRDILRRMSLVLSANDPDYPF